MELPVDVRRNVRRMEYLEKLRIKLRENHIIG